MTLKPVMMDELVGGQHYLIVEVMETGEILFNDYVLKGQPRKHEGRWVVELEDRHTYLTVVPVAELGLAPETVNLTHNRVFRANTHNRSILEDLNVRNDVRGYLQAINEEHVEEKLNLMAMRCEEVCNRFDEIFDDKPSAGDIVLKSMRLD